MITHLAATGGDRGGPVYFFIGALLLAAIGVLSVVWPRWAKAATRGTRNDPGDDQKVRLLGYICIAAAVLCGVVGIASL